VKTLRKIVLAVDTFLETFATLALLSMILIIVMNVFTRKLFNMVFFWTEEATLVLLVWFAFMGIALGFREGLHIAMESITEALPASVNKVLDKIIIAATFVFGLYLVFQGWEFTVLMSKSTLAATKLPNSTLYAVLPLSGLMIIAYSALQLIGIDTKRHRGLEEGGE
jgi:TRAP-type C4-dicarboxylate transport system permease small subunit